MLPELLTPRQISPVCPSVQRLSAVPHERRFYENFLLSAQLSSGAYKIGHVRPSMCMTRNETAEDLGLFLGHVRPPDVTNDIEPRSF